MNILVINHYSGGPSFGMEFRTFYLAREWRALGHNVTIVSATYSHLRKVNPSTKLSIEEQDIDGIKHIWLKTPPYQGNGLKRVINMFSFVSKTWWYAKRIIDAAQPDVVIASSTYPLDIHCSHHIAKKSKAKLIFEVHDIWPLTPMELGNMSANHPFIRLLQHAEDKAYKVADNVVSILPCAKEHMVSRGMNPLKFNAIPNGIVAKEWGANEFKIPDEHQAVFSQLKRNNKFIVGYAGGHALSNSLDNLIDASESLPDNIAIVLVGDGAEKSHLMEKAERYGRGNLFFLPSVNKGQVPDLLNQFDCGLVAAKKSTLYRFGVSPNKVFDYMMAKKPIIQAIEAGNDLVGDAKCGFSIKAECTDSLIDIILKMSKMEKAQLNEFGENGFKYVMEHHDYPRLAKHFIDVMES